MSISFSSSTLISHIGKGFQITDWQKSDISTSPRKPIQPHDWRVQPADPDSARLGGQQGGGPPVEVVPEAEGGAPQREVQPSEPPAEQREAVFEQAEGQELYQQIDWPCPGQEGVE